MATKVNMFNSINEVLETINPDLIRVSNNEFFGAEYPQAVDLIRNGASEADQREARELIAKVNTEIAGRKRNEWQRSVAGPRISVPAHVMGHPRQAYRKRPTESRKAPVRIVVETTISHNVEPEQIKRRGAAIAALVYKMGETRPVELYSAYGAQLDRTDYVGMIRLESTPIGLGYLCAITNTREYSRRILFSLFYTLHGRGPKGGRLPWAWRLNPESSGRIAMMREHLGLAEQDIFIPGGYLASASKMLSDPVGWVENHLAAQR